MTVEPTKKAARTMNRLKYNTQKHDNRAIRCGQASGSAHVLVTITGRRWYHNVFRGFSWEREWTGVIA